MLVGVAGVVDWLVRYGLTQVGVEVSFQFLMAAMVIVWLIINELISILETWRRWAARCRAFYASC